MAMGTRRRAIAVLAAVLAALTLAGAGATAAGAAVTNVTTSYQGSTTAGEQSEFVTVAFTLQASQAAGQAISLSAPGIDLRRASIYSLNIGNTGWALGNRQFSNDGSIASFVLPAPINVPTLTEFKIGGLWNPTRAGDYTWSVTAPGDGTGSAAPFPIVAGPISKLAVTAGSAQNGRVGEPFAPVTVRTTDAVGNPVAPAAPLDVTFETPASGPSATFPGGLASAVVTSDANGVATSPVATANTLRGQWDLSVSAPGLTGVSNWSFNASAEPASIALDLEPPLLAVGADPATATVTMGDRYGNAVTPDDLQGLGAGDAPELTAVGGAQAYELAWTGDAWQASVETAAAPGRSTVRASFAALSVERFLDSALAPLLGTPSATVGGETSATVAIPLDPRNAATAYRVEYGVLDAGERSTAPVTVARDAAPGTVTVTLTGLTAGTSYLYRFVAENALGRRTSATQLFKTAAAPVLPPGGGGGGEQPPGGGGGGVTPPPGGGGGGTPAPGRGAGGTPAPGREGARSGGSRAGGRRAARGPRLTRAALTPRAFRPLQGRRGGATLRFTLDRPVKRVGLRVELRGGRGWRAVVRGAWIPGRRGRSSYGFTGVVNGRALAPGRYRLVLTPGSGRAVTLPFTILR